MVSMPNACTHLYVSSKHAYVSLIGSASLKKRAKVYKSKMTRNIRTSVLLAFLTPLVALL